MIRTLLIVLFFVTIAPTYSQLNKTIDSLIALPTQKPFNGIILISQNGKTIYSKLVGYSDIGKKIPLTWMDEFVIGSISKQFTAVIVLNEFDKGHLKLSTPIHTYLPELTQSWADTVTVHHLLTHTHGILSINKPASFIAGKQYSYSQLGFDLLAKIVERTSGKSFSKLSEELFNSCGMLNSFHPDIKEYKNLVKGYTENEKGIVEFESASLENFVAAGSFISTPKDLIIWNHHMHNGKLLKASTYKLMTTKQKNAIRQHPIFGLTEYGYGITVDTKDELLQLGQTGFAPGFITMNFYFPKTKTSIVVLENVAFDTPNLKKTFSFHTEILKIIRQFLRN